MNLVVNVQGIIGIGSSMTVTLLRNGVATGLSVTIPGTGLTPSQGVDLGSEAFVGPVPGPADSFDLQVTGTGIFLAALQISASLGIA